jgi:peptide chain release factor 1
VGLAIRLPAKTTIDIRKMFDKLTGVEERFIDIEKHLADPEVVQDRTAYQKFVIEHAELNKIVTAYRRYKQTLNDLEGSQELLKDTDPEIKDLAREEINQLNLEKEKIEEDLKTLLLPTDPNDDKNVIVEIRAGTGGEEAHYLPATSSGCTAAMPRDGTGRRKSLPIIPPAWAV